MRAKRPEPQTKEQWEIEKLRKELRPTVVVAVWRWLTGFVPLGLSLMSILAAFQAYRDGTAKRAEGVRLIATAREAQKPVDQVLLQYEEQNKQYVQLIEVMKRQNVEIEQLKGAIGKVKPIRVSGSNPEVKATGPADIFQAGLASEEIQKSLEKLEQTRSNAGRLVDQFKPIDSAQIDEIRSKSKKLLEVDE
jgi:hypothetical protein